MAEKEISKNIIKLVEETDKMVSAVEEGIRSIKQTIDAIKEAFPKREEDE